MYFTTGYISPRRHGESSLRSKKITTEIHRGIAQRFTEPYVHKHSVNLCENHSVRSVVKNKTQSRSDLPCAMTLCRRGKKITMRSRSDPYKLFAFFLCALCGFASISSPPSAASPTSPSGSQNILPPMHVPVRQ